MSSNLRMSRINKQLQREIALIIETQIQKESVKTAIITGVECTKDLERAKVFFTALEARKCPGILKDLNEIKGAIRGMLGQSIKLRRVPALEFIIDKSSEYGAKIDKILDGLKYNSESESEAESENNDDE